MKTAEPSIQDANDKFESIKKTSQRILSKSKGLCAVIVTAQAVIALPSNTDQHQPIIAEISKQTPWFISVNEIWIYPFGQRDQQREAIMVALFADGKITRAEQCLFRRDKDGDIYFEDWSTFGSATLVALEDGRFGGI